MKEWVVTSLKIEKSFGQNNTTRKVCMHAKGLN